MLAQPLEMTVLSGSKIVSFSRSSFVDAITILKTFDSSFLLFFGGRDFRSFGLKDGSLFMIL